MIAAPGRGGTVDVPENRLDLGQLQMLNFARVVRFSGALKIRWASTRCSG